MPATDPRSSTAAAPPDNDETRMAAHRARCQGCMLCTRRVSGETMSEDDPRRYDTMDCYPRRG